MGDFRFDFRHEEARLHKMTSLLAFCLRADDTYAFIPRSRCSVARDERWMLQERGSADQ